VGGAEPAEDARALGVAGGAHGTGSLPVTGAGLLGLALAGLALSGTGALLTRTRRTSGAAS
jgi:LPXTG-motif cell wall-anchored protein